MIREYRQRALEHGVSWPIRLRLLLIVPGSHPWNRWVRNWTARMEGWESYEDETTPRAAESGDAALHLPTEEEA